MTASTPFRPSTGPAATARAFGDRLDLARQADAMIARPIPIRTVPRAALQALAKRVRRESGAEPIGAMVAGFNRAAAHEIG